MAAARKSISIADAVSYVLADYDSDLSDSDFEHFFSWEARNGGIILTREPEIIIVTYIYVPWAPRHICCDVYIRPAGFKGSVII